MAVRLLRVEAQHPRRKIGPITRLIGQLRLRRKPPNPKKASSLPALKAPPRLEDPRFCLVAML